MRIFFIFFLIGAIPMGIGAVSMIISEVSDFTFLMLKIGAVGFLMFAMYLVGTMIIPDCRDR